MLIESQAECAHKPCVCQVITHDGFCGEGCKKAAAENSDTCVCGHIDCAIEPALPDPFLIAAI